MSYDSALDELMADSITVRQPGSRNIYGEVSSTGAAKTHRARILYQPRMVVRSGGEEVTSAGRAWVSGTVPTSITASSILTLPDGSSPEILRVDTFHDEDGQHHQVVYF